VIEIKTKVTASDVNSIWQNMRSVKDLEKSAYFLTSGPIEHSVTVHGTARPWSPTLYFLWVYECADPLAFTNACQSLASGTDPSQRLDMACFLDGAVMVNTRPDHSSFSALPDFSTIYGLVSHRERASHLVPHGKRLLAASIHPTYQSGPVLARRRRPMTRSLERIASDGRQFRGQRPCRVLG